LKNSPRFDMIIPKEMDSMKRKLRFAVTITVSVIALLSLIGQAGQKNAINSLSSPSFNILTKEEAAQGWVLLFDGKTFKGWRGLGRDAVPKEHWIIEDNAIKKVPTKDVPRQADGQPLAGGDLMTIDTFEDFELAFDWKISPAGNSGVKYNVSEEMSLKNAANRAALGFEYQILDDEKNPDAKNGPNRMAAALYDLIAPQNNKLKPVGEYNTAKIVFKGGRGEHWLNGVKVLEYDLGTPRMNELLAKSKYKSIPSFAQKRKGHIVLQDHTDAVWYRNIKIRRIK
jgi:hypothetical protein